MTLAPCSCKKMADDTPERPSPTTRTLLFFNSIVGKPRTIVPRILRFAQAV